MSIKIIRNIEKLNSESFGCISSINHDYIHNEEDIRSFYKNEIDSAKSNNLNKVILPIFSDIGSECCKEESLRVAIDVINCHIEYENMDITLVVLDNEDTDYSNKIYPDLDLYIDEHFIEPSPSSYDKSSNIESTSEKSTSKNIKSLFSKLGIKSKSRLSEAKSANIVNFEAPMPSAMMPSMSEKPQLLNDFDEISENAELDVEIGSIEPIEILENKLNERLSHMTDTFSKYLLYLIEAKGMSNSDVYKRAIVDKKTFSKIKNNIDYHPQKITALCLCIGAKLNIDETKDLLARAGYALSPCDMTDIIFSYFIENGIYDMIELDIQLEEHGLSCIIS